MTKFLTRWVINVVALYAALWLLEGRINYAGAWTGVLWLALIFGLLNALVRPALKLLTCPLIILTLGLFTFVINAFIFWLASLVGQSFGFGLTISAPVWWNAFLGSLVVSLVSVVLSVFLKDDKKD